MDAHTVTEQWEPRPFDGGYDGLRRLQRERFDGAVEAAGTWLFLAAGEPVAAVRNLEDVPSAADVSGFEDTAGTALEASTPAVARLAAMLALDGEVRGQYFTDETPLSTVDETLADGGFTGYVELSENVLSGDYYVVYEDGDASNVAFVGTSNQLLAGEEAADRMADEVGIYSVVAVDLPELSLPAPEPESDPAPEPDEATGPAATTDAGSNDPDVEPVSEVDGDPADDDGGDRAGSSVEAGLDEVATTAADDEPTEPAESQQGAESRAEADDAAVDAAIDEAEPEPEPRSEPADAGPDTSPTASDTAAGAPTGTSQSPAATTPAADTAGAERDPAVQSDAGRDEPLADVTARAIPSLDPENSGRAADSSTPATSGEPSPPDDPEPAASTDPSGPPEESMVTMSPEPPAEPAVDEAAIRAEYEEKLDALREDLESLRAERDRLQDRLAQQQRDGAGPTAGASLGPTEALAATSLFVRPRSRSGPTLEDAHSGAVDRDALVENLRIEYHTQFDDADATVDGQPFEQFLRSSTAHRFVEWLVLDLLFEIRSVGATGQMRPLYDALPMVDRVAFHDEVDLEIPDEEETAVRQVGFDIVARDRMGDPVVVADLDESREPTRDDSMRGLIDDATDVADIEGLAGAFAVTSSFFEPEAVDAAREVTSGSLLSRDKRYSYVKLGRKRGYHLCLVEARGESFHLTVPEL